MAHHILDRYSYIITLLVPDGALYEGKISENPACHLHCIGHLECGVSPIHPRDCSFSLWLDKGLVGGDSMRRRIDEQLLIALFDLSHSEELFELIHHNRDHFGKWLEFPHKTHTVEDARNFITRCIHKNASGNGGWCGIWDEHRLIGAIGLNRIEIRVQPENLRSRKIPESIGFAQEGTLRQAEWFIDRFVDKVVYGLFKEEWNMASSS
ncbi:GNAT family N-acetyltransferase [Paenibacillus timonensis]|uniref:GNAT family N-acetyltransferase n=1 Tax=Paenibacillus timonensis TaxID=225915 RepID=A0ABW3SBK7_9BACL|nr:GNAT family N-acetyltransferase [Paenibacillus timonensis]MCH1639919.1 GNAT family N-acetyltransferase [Paenibacillus timonensis]